MSLSRVFVFVCSFILLLTACEPQSNTGATNLSATASDTSSTPKDQTGKLAKNDGAANKKSDDKRIPDVDIPFTKFVLDNGLTLIVHEDHKSPIVAVNMWYHVGSKDEGPSQTGFAHLFEHLMFQGSENWSGEYFEPFERAGATCMNGTTSTDRTNYFANVPTPALDMALWMESDRMGHFLGAVDEARLEEQREVVINEKKQRANQPYGKAWELLPPNTYPDGHPYSWSTIGSEKDLNAATVEDVRAWFKQYYGPSNAVLVIAGDITPEQAKKKVEHYFGAIPAGPALQQQNEWVAKMTGEHRQSMQDHVPQARIYKVWNVAADGSDELARLELVSDLLAGSKTSRLYKRLVYEDQIATDVSASIWGKEIGSQFLVWATARPDADLEKVEAALDEEMAKFLEEGPTKQELERVKTSIAADFLRGTENIGGFGGKSDILAQGEVYQGDPAAYKSYLQVLRQASPKAVRDTAKTWLSDGVYVLEVKPFGKHSTHKTDVDRSKLPDIGDAPDLNLPELQHAELENGLKIRLAERHEAPVVQFRLIMDAGYAADPETTPGIAGMTLAMLDEGTKRRNALEISSESDSLGANISSGSSLDSSTVNLSAISSLVDESMDLYADIVRNPAFPEKELERLKKQRLAQIQQEKSSPTSLALRVFGPLLYGDQHAYGIPLTGSGTEAAVEKIAVSNLQEFHKQWIRPDNATLVVVGDIKMSELKPLLEKHFGDWQTGTAELPKKRLPQIEQPNGQRIYLLNRPGSQATIIAGNLAPPKSDPQNIAMNTLNSILGGAFNSRLNLNLREEKRWSYGARSLLMDAKAQQPFIAYASVQTDKTAASMKEMLSEIRSISSKRPPTASELADAQNNLTRKLPGENETSGAIAGTLSESVIFNLPEDYYDSYVSRVSSLDIPELTAAAKSMLAPDALTWVVVGDLEAIEANVRKLNWGPVEVLNEDE